MAGTALAVAGMPRRAACRPREPVARLRRLRGVAFAALVAAGSRCPAACASAWQPSGGGGTSAAAAAAATGHNANAIDLDGSWQFETADKRFVGRTVSVPAVWQTQGVGELTGLLHWQYIGLGIYSKTVDLSQRPANCTCWLWIGGAPGGVVRSATISANGVRVGRHVGYLSPVEMQLPCGTSTGSRLDLTVAVDSRWNTTADPLYGSGSWDMSFGGFGGIVGHARVLFRRPAWIEDSLHVRSSPVVGSTDGSWQSTFTASVLGSLPGAGSSGSGAAVLHVRVCEDVPSSVADGGACAGGGSASAAASKVGERIALAVTIPRVKLWVPGTRAARASLYYANFTLVGADGAVLAQRSIRYGVRQMELVGNRIVFNGERLFLRGYGDDAAYASTAAPPTDKGFYYRQLSDMKALGFNHIRLHTHSMPAEFFDVADELGMLCNPEFAITHEGGPTQTAWLNSSLTRQVLNRSFTSIVQRHAYRPSIFSWVLSNEMYFSNAEHKYWYDSGDNSKLFVELYRYAKAFDPERPCYYADGVTQTGLGTTVEEILGPELSVANLACRDGANASNAGCFADILVTQAGWGHTQYAPSWFSPLWRPAGPPGSHGPPFWWYSPDDGSLLPPGLPVPSIIHEAYDGRTFPRLESNRDSFDGALVRGGELYCNQSITRLKELNLLHENHLWSQASEELYTQWMKVYIEGYHLDATTSGYEWWVGYDWFGLSNGLIGGHENQPRPKPGISNDTLRSVQREIMLLTPDPLLKQKAAWAPGQHVALPLLLQNLTFGGFPSWNNGANLVWSATTISDGQIIAHDRQMILTDAILQGDTGLLCNISFTLPASIEAHDTVTVRAEVQMDGSTWPNSWNLGVFPQNSSKSKCAVPVFATPSVLSATRLHYSTAATLPAVPDELPRTPFVLVAGHEGIDDATAAVLNTAGGAAVLLNPSTLPACTGLQSINTTTHVDAFHQPWWSSAGSTCALAYNSSLVRDWIKLRGSFVPFAFAELITNATAYVLDNVSRSAAAGVRVHLRNVPVDATDKTVCNGGNGCGAQMTTVSSQALVFEAPLLLHNNSASTAATAGLAAAKGATALVSGLDMLNASFLPKSPQTRWAFAAMIDYALSTAANQTRLAEGGD